jgi:hypothetical protein
MYSLTLLWICEAEEDRSLALLAKSCGVSFAYRLLVGAGEPGMGSLARLRPETGFLCCLAVTFPAFPLLTEPLFFVSISFSAGYIREMLDWVVDPTFEKFRLLTFFEGLGAPAGAADPISPLLLRSEFNYCGVCPETEP